MKSGRQVKNKIHMDELNKYIRKRYDRWLDYSTYHCTCAGIDGEGVDVLNEVLCDLLQKPQEQLLSLLNKKSGQYRELDYFVLRMIKLNATSPTSPYRYRYKGIPTDGNVDYQRLDLEDEIVDEDAEDRVDTILSQTRQVRQVLDELNLEDDIRAIFEWRFFHHEPYSSWEGPESDKFLYETYRKVIELIKSHIRGETLF